jgi:hypothetical protein
MKLKGMAYGGESIWCDGITFEELWCIYLEAVTSKVVGKELDHGISSFGRGEGGIKHGVIRVFEAEDVCQVYHSLVLRVIDFGSSDICLDTIDLFIRPLKSGRGIGVLKSET